MEEMLKLTLEENLCTIKIWCHNAFDVGKIILMVLKMHFLRYMYITINTLHEFLIEL